MNSKNRFVIRLEGKLSHTTILDYRRSGHYMHKSTRSFKITTVTIISDKGQT